MRTHIAQKSGRYALAALLLAIGLVSVAACGQSVKEGPPKEPPPTGLAIVPVEHDFEEVPLNMASDPFTFTIANNGPNDAEALSVFVDGTDVEDFFVTSGTDGCTESTLADGATCTVDVQFSPIAAGDRAATLVVTAQDPADGTDEATLLGTGVEQQ
jgi:hypothetical protein